MGGTEFILILSWFVLQRKSKIKTIEKRHLKRRCWRKMGKHREDGDSWRLLISLFSINIVPSKHPLTISFPWHHAFPLYSFLSLCHLKALLNPFYLSLSNVYLSLSPVIIKFPCQNERSIWSKLWENPGSWPMKWVGTPEQKQHNVFQMPEHWHGP